MTLSMIEELKHLGFHTVEQLAGASDSVCSKFAGLQMYKQKAIAFIEYAKGSPAIDKMSREIDDLRNERDLAAASNHELAESVKMLRAQVEALQKVKV